MSQSFSRGLAGRVAAVGLTSMAVLCLWAPAAGAAPAVTITVDPDATQIQIHPTYGNAATADHLPGYGTGISVVPVMYGGTLTVSLPAAVQAGPSFRVQLGLQPTSGGSTTRTYATDSGVPADVLVVNDLGSKRYEVELPADDGINGDFGFVVLTGLVPAPGASGITTDGRAGTPLAFGAAPTNVDLPLGVVVDDSRCIDPSLCTPIRVAPGGSLSLTLPSSSRLTPLGFTSLATNSVRLQPTTGGAIVPLSGSVSADGRTLTATVPSTMAGTAHLTLEIVDATGTQFASVWYIVDVTNTGLMSNTGWGENEEAAPTGTSPLVPIGAGMVLVAGLGTAVVLRRRTSAQG